MTEKELEQIYNEAYKPVYWTAMALLKNEADAEDVVQDTFIAFMESYPDMTDTSKAVPLLKKIAANKCLNRIKLARTDNEDDEFFDSVEAVPEDFLPDTIVESEAMRKIVMDIIEKALSDDIRRTLILFYFDEMSTKEIAEALKIPQGSVLRRLNFARNKIKKEVEKYEKENNTKLFAMAIPFLSKLFIKEAEQVAFKPMPAKLVSLSASVKASGAGTKVAASAAKKGTGMINKFVIGGVASAVAVGATVGVVLTVINKPESKLEPVETTVIETEKESGSGTGATQSTKATSDSAAATTEADDAYESKYYLIDDLSPEEIVDIYVYNHDCVHSVTPDNKEAFEQYIQVEPYDYHYTNGNSIAIRYSMNSDGGVDHIIEMFATASKSKNNYTFAMEFAVYDRERAQAIMDAYRDHYAVDGATVDYWDNKGQYEDGYMVTVDKHEKYVVGIQTREYNGVTYYYIRFSEILI